MHSTHRSVSFVAATVRRSEPRSLGKLNFYKAWLLLLSLLVGLTSCKPKQGDHPGSRYVRHEPGNRVVIVFVHGVFGDAKTTWTSSNRTYWPDLLLKDPHFNGADVFVYSYPSPALGKSLTIDELADDMRLVFDGADPKVFDHTEVVFLTHSMGGLVARAFLLKYRNLAPKVRFMYFYATPTTGSAIGNVAAAISRNPQLRGLMTFPDQQYLPALQSNWLAAGFPIASYCAVEEQATYGVQIVSRESATNMCTQPLDPINADHINIVKPSDMADRSYIAFRNAYEATRASTGLTSTSVEQKNSLSPTPNSQSPPSTFANAKAVAAGGGFSCAVDSAQNVSCWGSNAFGKLGNGTFAPSSTPVLLSGGIRFSELTLGDEYGCGISTTLEAYCWGRNDSGQLGDSTRSDRTVPVRVSGGIRFRSVSAGVGEHTCGIAQDGTAFCWGRNDQGQLGIGTRLNSTSPVRVLGDAHFSSITVGAFHSCAVRDEGTAWCWGYNINGALGSGNTSQSSVPVEVSGGQPFGSVSGGSFFTCASTRAGSAYCWGNNAFGGLGNGAAGNSSVPVQVAGGLTVSSIATGNYHACATTATNAAYCWGFGDYGSLGNGQRSSSPTPVAVTGGIMFTALSAGVDHTCGLARGGSIFCWGRNTEGQLGTGNQAPSATPVQVVAAQ